jgi:hypothetical protein
VTAARVAEITPDGVCVSLAGEPVPVEQEGEREAELRAAALRALRNRE